MKRMIKSSNTVFFNVKPYEEIERYDILHEYELIPDSWYDRLSFFQRKDDKDDLVVTYNGDVVYESNGSVESPDVIAEKIVSAIENMQYYDFLMHNPI